MTTKTIKLYKFEELSKEAQEKTVEALRDINVDYYWHTVTEWEFKDKMKLLGYEVKEVYFSGFYSQGDGACFEGTVSIAEWLLAHKLGRKYRSLLNYCRNYGGYVTIKQSGHYYHEYSMTFDESDTLCSYYYLDYERYSAKIGAQIDEVLKLIENESIEKAKELYKELENEYDSRMTDEAVTETIIANEYDFLAEGGKIQ